MKAQQRVLLPSSVLLLTITLCLLQPLSQNHPSGIQPHTQLHLPEGLSLAATSLLTEVRGLGGWEGGWFRGWGKAGSSLGSFSGIPMSPFCCPVPFLCSSCSTTRSSAWALEEVAWQS